MARCTYRTTGVFCSHACEACDARMTIRSVNVERRTHGRFVTLTGEEIAQLTELYLVAKSKGSGTQVPARGSRRWVTTFESIRTGRLPLSQIKRTIEGTRRYLVHA